MLERLSEVGEEKGGEKTAKQVERPPEQATAQQSLITMGSRKRRVSPEADERQPRKQRGLSRKRKNPKARQENILKTRQERYEAREKQQGCYWA